MQRDLRAPLLAAIGAAAFMNHGALAQKNPPQVTQGVLDYWWNGSASVPTSSSNPLPVSGSVTATAIISPFTPNGTISSQATVTGTSAPFTLPVNGGAVMFSNTGTLPVEIKIAGGTTAATAADLALPPGAVMALGVGTLTVANMISTGTVLVNMAGGTGVLAGVAGAGNSGSGTQTVAGTVAATQSGTWTGVTIVPSGTQSVAGTINVSGTVPVSGTVTSTPSGTTTVAGTVAVSGTVPVSGTIAVSGTVPVSGTVTATPTGTTTVAGTVGVSGTIPVFQALDFGFVAGTSTRLKNTVTISGTTTETLLAGTSNLHNYVTDLMCFRTDAGTTLAYVTLNDDNSTPYPLPVGSGAAPPIVVPIVSNGTNTAITFSSQASITGTCTVRGYSGTWLLDDLPWYALPAENGRGTANG